MMRGSAAWILVRLRAIHVVFANNFVLMERRGADERVTVRGAADWPPGIPDDAMRKKDLATVKRIQYGA
ncbi:MAG: hypothetical protein ACJ79P_18135, partial [Myxococcales bacterium]